MKYEVSGATLYYEMHGAGSLLLVIPGGDGDADFAKALTDRLAARYRVLLYDPRGLSRSTLRAPPDDQWDLQTHADDAYRLLDCVTGGPALVFGTSRGALVGLDLAVRYGERVSRLVAHEPPLPQLLPEAEAEAAVRAQEEVEAVFGREGVGSAMRRFAELSGVDLTEWEAGADLPRPGPERAANLSFFLANDAPAVRRYRLDVDRLRASPAEIVPAVGTTSAGKMPHRSTELLAERLGTEVVAFPGGHSGYLTHPHAFADALLQALLR